MLIDLYFRGFLLLLTLLGKNSPYALGLVRAIKMSNLTIEAVLKQTLNWVNDTTNGKQVPWYSSSLRGEFYFSKK